MNLNFFESNEIKKFITSKENLTFDEKKEILNFIDSRKKSYSFEEKAEIVKFVDEVTNTNDSTPTKIVETTEIIDEVIKKIKADESFVLSLSEDYVELISNTLTSKLKSDTKFLEQFVGATGQPGKDGEPGLPGKDGVPGKTVSRGLPGKFNSQEIVNLLKTDNEFISLIRQGQQYWYAGGSGGPSVSEIIDIIHQYGGSVTGPYISTINSTSGDILLSAGDNVSINQFGNTFVFSASTTSVSAGVATVNNLIGNVILSGIPMGKS
jgi:hypothetical protein